MTCKYYSSLRRERNEGAWGPQGMLQIACADYVRKKVVPESLPLELQQVFEVTGELAFFLLFWYMPFSSNSQGWWHLFFLQLAFLSHCPVPTPTVAASCLLHSYHSRFSKFSSSWLIHWEAKGRDCWSERDFWEKLKIVAFIFFGGKGSFM